MVLASSRSQASPSLRRAPSRSSPSISMSKILPWRTFLRPSMESDRSAPSIALPCGSSTPDLRVTVTRAFTNFKSPAFSGRVRPRRHGQKRIERRRIARRAQLGGDCAIAQQARAHRQRLEMIGAGRLGGDQHENEIDRQAVRRLEIDWAIEAGENAPELLPFWELPIAGTHPAPPPPRAPPPPPPTPTD